MVLCVARAEYRVGKIASIEVAAVRRSYVAQLEEALTEHGPMFRDQFERSSDPLPTNLLIDDLAE